MHHVTLLAANVQLPDEIFLHIFSYLSPKDLIIAARVNKIFYSFSCNDSLWQAHVLRNWPLLIAVPNCWKTFYRESVTKKSIRALVSNGNVIFAAIHNRIAIFRPDHLNGHLKSLLKSDHTGPITALFTPKNNEEEGVLLYSGSIDRCIKIWSETPTSPAFKLRGSYRKHQGSITVLICHKNQIYSGDSNGKVIAWKGVHHQVFATHQGAITSLFYMHDTLISASKDGAISFHGTAKDSCYYFLQNDFATSLAPLQDLLLAGTSKGQLLLFKNNRLKGRYSVHRGAITAIATKGDQILTGGDDGIIHLFTFIKEGQELREKSLFNPYAQISGLLFHKGEILASTTSGKIHRWDSTTCKERPCLKI